MCATTEEAPGKVYQLKVRLRDSKPPIWRRVLVPEDFTLPQLHRVFQCLMDWYDYHLHEFTVDGQNYGEPDPEDIFPETAPLSERRVRLHELLRREGQKFLYLYDFGDGWEHDVLVEALLPADPNVHYPICIAGKRSAPPEDCGGIGGYENFLEAIRDPAHEEHQSMLDWIGGSFDPEYFSLEEINADLRTRFRQRTKKKAATA